MARVRVRVRDWGQGAYICVAILVQEDQGLVDSVARDDLNILDNLHRDGGDSNPNPNLLTRCVLCRPIAIRLEQVTHTPNPNPNGL